MATQVTKTCTCGYVIRYVKVEECDPTGFDIKGTCRSNSLCAPVLLASTSDKDYKRILDIVKGKYIMIQKYDFPV